MEWMYRRDETVRDPLCMLLHVAGFHYPVAALVFTDYMSRVIHHRTVEMPEHDSICVYV